MGDESTDEGVDHIRQIDSTVNECSPLKRGDVGDDKTVHWVESVTEYVSEESDLQKVIPELPRV